MRQKENDFDGDVMSSPAVGGGVDSCSTSPPPPSTIPGGGSRSSSSASPHHHPLTFWCHGCDMSVSLPLPTSSRLLCPHCSGDFLEEMDSPSPPPPLHHRSAAALTLALTDSDDDDSTDLTLALSPQAYLQGLIHLPVGDPLLPFPSAALRGPSPAPQTSIDAIPTVQISDAGILCAVCKDDLPLASPALCLPCSHLYHADCILPWLAQHNSCPVCRSQLPDDRPKLPAPYLDSSESLLRQIARRHRLVFPRPPALAVMGVEASPTQMAQAETGGSAWPTTSGETVSSAWPAAEGQNGGTRMDEEGDTVMSDVRSWEYLFD